MEHFICTRSLQCVSACSLPVLSMFMLGCKRLSKKPKFLADLRVLPYQRVLVEFSCLVIYRVLQAIYDAMSLLLTFAYFFLIISAHCFREGR